jgi:hypothetical protein
MLVCNCHSVHPVYTNVSIQNFQCTPSVQWWSVYARCIIMLVYYPSVYTGGYCMYIRYEICLVHIDCNISQVCIAKLDNRWYKHLQFVRGTYMCKWFKSSHTCMSRECELHTQVLMVHRCCKEHKGSVFLYQVITIRVNTYGTIYLGYC